MTFPELVRDKHQLFAVEELGGNWRFNALSPEVEQQLEQCDPAFLEALALPSKQIVDSELSGLQLLALLEQYFETILCLPAPDFTVLAAFTVSTFFADVLPLVPSIALHGYVPEQSISAFIAIASICRHAFIIDDSVPLTRVPLFLNPTLAIDATSATRTRLERLCRAGSPAIKRMIGSQIASCTTPRIILARECVRGASLSFALNPPSDLRANYTLHNAQRILDCLAAYRVNRRSAVTRNPNTSCLLVDTLLSCFPDDRLARERVSAALAKVSRTPALSCIGESNEENFLTQALYAAIHRGTSVRLLELANLTMDLFEREGMRRPVSPKCVGTFLREHGLTLRHTREGMVVDVNERSAEIAHSLYFEAFDADGEKFPDCRACLEGLGSNRIQ